MYNQSLRWKEVTKIFQISDVTAMAELVPVTNTTAFEVIFQNNVNRIGRTLTEKVIAILGLARFTIFFVLKFFLKCLLTMNKLFRIIILIIKVRPRNKP